MKVSLALVETEPFCTLQFSPTSWRLAPFDYPSLPFRIDCARMSSLKCGLFAMEERLHMTDRSLIRN